VAVAADLLVGVLAVAAIIAAEAVFVAVVALEEDSVAAAETTSDAMIYSRTHPHKADEVVREDSIAAAVEELKELNMSM
jgi:hypothetical protein